MTQNQHTAKLLPGVRLYKYELKHRIGGGNFGDVWLAKDNTLNQEFAIKILKPGTPIHERLREARIGHTLNHNNLVRVHHADVARLGGENYVIVAMDFLEKGPITSLANPSRFLPLPEVIRFGKDILKGLGFLHEQGLFHNDVKPENVLIGPNDQGMLTDYGIVGISDGGGPVAPPNCYIIHAAPEVVAQNGITEQTDIFQTGLTLFRMLVGLDVLRIRFNDLGEDQYYQAICSASLITKDSFSAFVPNRMRRIVLKAINPDLDERYGSALEMRRDLERLNYKGSWTVGASGEFSGTDGARQFRFEMEPRHDNRFDVTCFNKRVSSGRETRIKRFCISNLTETQARKAVDKFVKAVVEGV